MLYDEKSMTAPRRFLVDVEETIRVVHEQEDTDGDFQISITDAGPKTMSLGTATRNEFKTFDIQVHGMLAFLLNTNIRKLGGAWYAQVELTIGQQTDRYLQFHSRHYIVFQLFEKIIIWTQNCRGLGMRYKPLSGSCNYFRKWPFGLRLAEVWAWGTNHCPEAVTI